MSAWASGASTENLIPSEFPYFRKLSLAEYFKEPRQAIWDGETTEWLNDLALMVDAKNNPEEESLTDRLWTPGQ